jgi:hypothetical protein
MKDEMVKQATASHEALEHSKAEVRQPPCLPACLPACLPVCLPACLPACMYVCVPACLPACLPSLLPARAHMSMCVGGDSTVWIVRS